MSSTDALITAAMFIGTFGLAGALCWGVECWARRRQADWHSEGNARGIR